MPPTDDHLPPTAPDGPDAAPESEADPLSPTTRRLLGLVWVATLVLVGGALAALPFVGASMLGEFREEQATALYDLRTGAPVTAGEEVDPGGAEYLNVAVVNLDEAEGSLTLAISGNRDCDPCGLKRMTFFALDDDASQRRGLSPFATVVVAAGEHAFSESVTLPLRGSPTRYPFDVWRLRLGVSVPPPDSALRAGGLPSGGASAATPVPLPPSASGDRQVLATIQSQLSRFVMSPPTAIDPAVLPSASTPNAPNGVLDLRFRRPAYLPVLAVLLVVLVGASSALALLTQGVDSLLLGVGGLILAVWGVRSVLVPSSLQAVTAVDLALSGVILLLLIGVALRAAFHLQQRAGYRLPPLRRGPRDRA